MQESACERMLPRYVEISCCGIALETLEKRFIEEDRVGVFLWMSIEDTGQVMGAGLWKYLFYFILV